MKRSQRERIAVLSDGTGETAEAYVRAILAQFGRAHAELQRVPKLRTPTEVQQAIEEFSPPYLIVYSFATEQLRKMIWTEIKRKGLIGLDLLYPAVDIFSDFLQSAPAEQQAVLHSTQSFHYYDRMEAIDFTVKHDDGMRIADLLDANIILTGVSRTSKTPTSMYLGHRGFKVANVPLVYGIEPPEILVRAHEKKIPIIMLTIDPLSLQKIRKSRFEKLGPASSQSDTYVNVERIAEEIQAAIALARRFRWPVIDVTNKAIEETASEILLIVSPKD